MESSVPDFQSTVPARYKSPELDRLLDDISDTIHRISLSGMNAIISQLSPGQKYLPPFRMRIISDSPQHPNAWTVEVSVRILNP